MDSILLRNSVTTPDNTRLISRFRHDFVSHKDKNGKTYAIDGGTDYARWIGGVAKDCIDTSLYSSDSIEKLREGLTWGTRGKDGIDELKYVLIKDMTTEHIESVLKFIPSVANYTNVFKRELEYRNKEKQSKKEI